MEFKLKSECTKGPLSKVLLKGQGPPTSVSPLNIAANTQQCTCSSIPTSTAILTTYATTYLLLSQLIGAQWLMRPGLNQFECCYLRLVFVSCLREHTRARACARARARARAPTPTRSIPGILFKY